jgi:3-hydroxy-9,10-secoandrosta-1,3,5(10)-triene-9,17-dione monooxygenase reductase component
MVMTISETSQTSVEDCSPDPAVMRRVLGHFCTGVAVVTGHGGDGSLGFTCQSVTSVSLEPPYISFCPSNGSSSWPRIREAGSLCVNVLAADQRAVCWSFARSGGDKFAGVDWRPGSNGAPVLDGVLASIEADIEFEHEAGDHTIVVARVTALRAHPQREPLLFFRGDFGGFAGRVEAAGSGDA